VRPTSSSSPILIRSRVRLVAFQSDSLPIRLSAYPLQASIEEDALDDEEPLVVDREHVRRVRDVPHGIADLAAGVVPVEDERAVLLKVVGEHFAHGVRLVDRETRGVVRHDVRGAQDRRRVEAGSKIRSEVGRTRGEDTYLQIVGSFRMPSSTPSRKSHWRSTSLWMSPAQVSAGIHLDELTGRTRLPTWRPHGCTWVIQFDGEPMSCTARSERAVQSTCDETNGYTNDQRSTRSSDREDTHHSIKVRREALYFN
jgi:hypothetical protein